MTFIDRSTLLDCVCSIVNARRHLQSCERHYEATKSEAVHSTMLVARERLEYELDYACSLIEEAMGRSNKERK